MAATYTLPCGCVVRRESANVERIFKQCEPCAAEFNERHAASVRERRVAREKLWADEERVLAPGGLPVSPYQSNIRTAVHP